MLHTVVSTEYTNRILQRARLHYRIWALCAVLAIFALVMLSRQVTAIDVASSADQHLLTVYDQGDEKTFITNKTTIGAALREQNIAIEEVDAVEPAVTTKLEAKSYTVNVYRARSVIVEDNGVKTQVLTAEQSPKKILAKTGAVLYNEDKTEFQLASSPLAEGGAGLRLAVKRAPVVNFVQYGKPVEIRTWARTVGELLKEKGIVLGAQDGQSLPNHTPITHNMNLAVWRDGKQTMTQEEVVARPTEEIKDADKEYGSREVRTQGSDGKKTVTYEIEMKNGQEVSRKAIASVTTVEPVKQVIVIGTRFKGAYTSPTENETITWNYLIGKGLTREQTAGVMGNLMQEHGFNTTGDGLAQWTGSRKAKLLSMPDPYNIYTQLDFMWSELSGGYASVLGQIRASSTVEGAVVAFQNGYERCGVCAEGKRIQFAYNILASH